jgi:hypothetical protein
LKPLPPETTATVFVPALASLDGDGESSAPAIAAAPRREDGRRHDAAQTIQAFSTHLRDQLDLDTLGAELLAVVDQTMQPTRASLWLRPSPQAPSPTQGRAS